jgi:hypothetical protein
VRLDEFCDEIDMLPFPTIGAEEHPEREVILTARQHVAEAVVDEVFLCDCITKELERLGEDFGRGGLAPFASIPDKGISLAFGYWPPGSTAGPHEHTAWTITAVCRNELTVTTYDWKASYLENALIPKNQFDAIAGRTGFILKTHCPVCRRPVSHVSSRPIIPTPRFSLDSVSRRSSTSLCESSRRCRFQRRGTA